MGLYNRLNLNFDTSRFGQAQTLSSGAANTLGLIASTSGALPTWQQQDLAAGSPVPTNYFQNPTATYLSNMLASANLLVISANTVSDSNTVNVATSLMIEITNFKSHTDNISGVVAVSNTLFPSLQSAQNMGQLNMMTLARSDGVSNTAPILGSFTSLFIMDEIQANANTILTFAQEYANSITSNVVGANTYYSSNLSNTIIATIDSYVSNTTLLLSTRRTSDWAFYRNSLQLAKDVGYMQQFSNMGATMSYLVNNVVGTPNLLSKLNS
jgi:hypothetical protein